jgi:hypothetical protein
MMSYNALPSAEVAQDFRDALQDLKMNSKPEISNLTVIAKENTEHAQAISRELEEHIRKVGSATPCQDFKIEKFNVHGNKIEPSKMVPS